jgi:cardiolipin synthase
VTAVERAPDEVLEAIADAARALPPPAIAAVAERLRAGTSDQQALEGLAVEAARARVASLLTLWRAHMGDGRGRELAVALESASAAHEWHRRNVTFELVWTGPTRERSALRRTDQALFELIRGARERLLLVSFAAYRVPTLHAALLEAAARGVAIDFVLESPTESQGRVSSDPLRAVGDELLRHATLWTWPLEARERDAHGRHGSLHAKCALADRRRLFVSSANLTAHALALNMELGVIIEGGRLPGEVAEHFEALMRHGVLGVMVRA